MTHPSIYCVVLLQSQEFTRIYMYIYIYSRDWTTHPRTIRTRKICPTDNSPIKIVFFFRKNILFYGLTTKKYNTLCADNFNYENRLGKVRLGKVFVMKYNFAKRKQYLWIVLSPYILYPKVIGLKMIFGYRTIHSGTIRPRTIYPKKWKNKIEKT